MLQPAANQRESSARRRRRRHSGQAPLSLRAQACLYARVSGVCARCVVERAGGAGCGRAWQGMAGSGGMAGGGGHISRASAGPSAFPAGQSGKREDLRNRAHSSQCQNRARARGKRRACAATDSAALLYWGTGDFAPEPRKMQKEPNGAHDASIGQHAECETRPLAPCSGAQYNTHS